MPKGKSNKKPVNQGKRFTPINQKSGPLRRALPSSSPYAVAMFDPFGKGAVGAQIPDHYSAPTAPYHIKSRFTVSTDATGTADVIIIPSAADHAYCPVGALDGGVNLTARDGTVYANGLVLTNSLSGKLANYRIVAQGVRIKAVTSMTNSSGSAIIGLIPAECVLLGNAPVGGVTPAVDAAQTLAAWYDAMGIPYTGVGAAARISTGGIDNLPVSTSCSVLHLAEKPMLVRPKPISAYNSVFRSTTDRQFGFDTVNQPAGITDCGDGSYARINGMETMVLKLHGCAASTAVLEIEVIYHVEGTPYLPSSAVSLLGAGSAKPHVSMVDFGRVLDAVARAPSFIEEAAGGALRIMSAGRAIAGAIGYV